MDIEATSDVLYPVPPTRSTTDATSTVHDDQYLQPEVIENVIQNCLWLVKFDNAITKGKSGSNNNKMVNEMDIESIPDPQRINSICTKLNQTLSSSTLSASTLQPLLLGGKNQRFLDRRIHTIFLEATNMYLEAFQKEQNGHRFSMNTILDVESFINLLVEYNTIAKKVSGEHVVSLLNDVKLAKDWSAQANQEISKYDPTGVKTTYGDTISPITGLIKSYETVLVEDSTTLLKLRQILNQCTWGKEAGEYLSGQEGKILTESDFPIIEKLLSEGQALGIPRESSHLAKLVDWLQKGQNLRSSYEKLQREKKEALESIRSAFTGNKSNELIDCLQKKPTLESATTLREQYKEQKVEMPGDLETDIATVEKFWREEFTKMCEPTENGFIPVDPFREKRKEMMELPLRDVEKENEFLRTEWVLDFKTFKITQDHPFEALDSLYSYYLDVHEKGVTLDDFDQVKEERDKVLNVRQLIEGLKIRSAALISKESLEGSFHDLKAVFESRQSDEFFTPERISSALTGINDLKLIKLTEDVAYLDKILEESKGILDEVTKMTETLEKARQSNPAPVQRPDDGEPKAVAEPVGMEEAPNVTQMVPEEEKPTESVFRALIEKVLKSPIVLPRPLFTSLLETLGYLGDLEKLYDELASKEAMNSAAYHDKLKKLFAISDVSPIKPAKIEELKAELNKEAILITTHEELLYNILIDEGTMPMDAIEDIIKQASELHDKIKIKPLKFQLLSEIVRVKLDHMRLDAGLPTEKTLERLQTTRGLLKNLKSYAANHPVENISNIESHTRDIIENTMDAIIRLTAAGDVIVLGGGKKPNDDKTPGGGKSNNNDQKRDKSSSIKKENVKKPETSSKTDEDTDWINRLHVILKEVKSGIDLPFTERVFDYLKRQVKKAQEKHDLKLTLNNFLDRSIQELKGKMKHWSASTLENSDGWQTSIRKHISRLGEELAKAESDNSKKSNVWGSNGKKDKLKENERKSISPENDRSKSFEPNLQKRKNVRPEDAKSSKPIVPFNISVNEDMFNAYTPENEIAKKIFDEMDSLGNLSEGDFYKYIEEKMERVNNICVGFLEQQDSGGEQKCAIADYMRAQRKVGRSIVQDQEVFLMEKTHLMPKNLKAMVTDLESKLKSEKKEVNYQLIFVIVFNRKHTPQAL